MMAGDFTYGESYIVKPGLHSQVISLRGREIGFLRTQELNWFAPLIERYLLPDAEKGFQKPTPWMLKGMKGWIDFKVFDNYDDALNYAKKHLNKLIIMFKFGDWD